VNTKFAFRWVGLRTKIIAWSFVPTAIILLAVALVTFFAFQSVTEELVLERDLKVTSVSASQLATQLKEYEDLLTSVARSSDIYQSEPATQRDALKRAGNRLALFDGGVLLLDAFGAVVAAEPERPEVLGQNWSDRSYYQQVVRSQIVGSNRDLVLSNIVADGPRNGDVIVVALPVLGEQEEFQGTLLGMFRVSSTVTNAFYGDIVRLRVEEGGSTYLVDGEGRVIYHSLSDRIGENFGEQKVVQQVLSGQVDAIRTRDFAGTEIVAGFAPLPGTPWGLVSEETWANLTSSFRGYRNSLLFLLALGVMVPAIVVGIGVRRITQPITDLIGAAQEVAKGKFGQTITARTGDEIEDLAGQFNLMSAQLQASYANLEQKVADRTKELATLNTISAVVSRSLHLDEILSDALDEILTMLEVEAGSILLVEPGAEILTPRVHRGFSEEFLRAVPRIRLGEGVSGQAVTQGTPVVLNIEDYARAGLNEHLAPALAKEGLKTLASIPILHKGQALGTLTVATKRPRAIRPQEQDLLTAIGQQIGVAVENARLFRDATRQVRELRALSDASRIISSVLDQDQLLQAIYEQITHIAPTDFYLIALYDEATNVVSIEINVDEGVHYAKEQYVLDKGLLKQVIHNRQPLRFDSLTEEKHKLGIEPLPTGSSKVNQGWLGVPMLYSDRVLGAIVVGSYQRGAFDAGHQQILTSIANQAAVALENARLYEQTQQELAERARAEKELRELNEERARRNRELVLLNRVIGATTSRLEINAVLEAVCRELTLAFDIPSVGAALLDESGEALTVVAEHKVEERPSALGAVIPVAGNPATQYVLKHKAPLAVADAQQDPRLAPVHDLMRERGVTSLLILPLTVRDEVVGTIGLDAVDGREFTDDEIALAANAAAAASQALKNARAEQELRQSEETLKLAMEGAGLGLWDQNLATGGAVIIRGWTETLGYAPGELPTTYESWYERVHPADKPKFAEAWSRYESGEAPLYEVEHRVQTKSGDWAWVLLRGRAVVRDEQGRPLRISGIHQDITARKRAEEALQRSQQRLSLHVQHTPLAYIEWDSDLNVTAWNPSAERIFGYSQEEAKQRHAYEIIVPPEVQPHVTTIWHSLLEQTGGTRSTNENMTKDGRRITCEWYNTPLIDDTGSVIGLASLVQDISKRVQAEEELRQAKDAAEEARRAAEAANRAKSVFLANMSHELRTPLNAILGFAQLMTRDSDLTTAQHENLDIIGRSGEHLLGLINDVLEMSKIEAGRTTLLEEGFDLYHMLGGLEEMFRLRAQDKGLVLIFDRAPDVPQYFRTDEGKLRQVLMNLLGNAVKFTSEGGVTLRVRHMDTSEQADQLRIDELATRPTCKLEFEIEDTGPGIAPDEMDAVFDPFKQTQSGQASQEGTGLGMPISRQFARLMGGDLTASSELGVGSIFKLVVQAELVDSDEVQTTQPARRVVGLDADQPVYRLLVVEDRDANRKLLVNILAPLGFEVREAINGQEAIEIWEHWEPHLIWMDLRMPVMDGYEATKRIKATFQGQATVIIALTASAFEQDRALILSEGCDDFVRKPFREEEIFDMLTKHLGVRFVYEKAYAESMGAEADGKQDTAEILSSGLAAMPADWVTSLHQAATQLDADVILNLLDQIREQNAPLADALVGLVRDFRFDAIMALTKDTES